MKMSSEHNVDCPFSWKFSIDNFTDDQIYLFKKMCYNKTTVNRKFTSLLLDEIKYQQLEKKKFYNLVAQDRMNNVSITDESKSSSISDYFDISKLWSTKSLHSYIKWHPPYTYEETVNWQYSPKAVLAGLPKILVDRNGTDRVGLAFLPWRFYENYSKHDSVQNFNFNFITKASSYSGLLVGVCMALEHAKKFMKDYERGDGSNIHTSKYDAYRSRHNAFIRGLVRYTFRWGWRTTFLVGTTLLCSQSLCIYRLEDSWWHYTLGAGLSFGLYNWLRGPRGILMLGSLAAICVGLPLGLMFGTLGYNPRTLIYNSYFVPKMMPVTHWTNWTDKEELFNQQRMNDMLQELDKHDDDIDIRIYDKFFN